MIDLDDQDRKREAAPVGPYAIATFTVDGAQRIVTAPKQFICNTLHGNDAAIAAFIVAACNANKELCNEVRRLRAAALMALGMAHAAVAGCEKAGNVIAAEHAADAASTLYVALNEGHTGKTK